MGSERNAELRLQGSNGYRITVRAARAPGQSQIQVEARKGPTSVTYVIPGSLGKDDSINALLPRLGRVAVRFDPVKVTRGITFDFCHGRPEVIERGTFRGTIELHGEQGFTEVKSSNATGSVTHSFRQVCHVGGHGTSNHPRPKPKLDFLIAGEDREENGLHFSALQASLGAEAALMGFGASMIRQQEGMEIISEVGVEATRNQLVFSKPGSPKVVGEAATAVRGYGHLPSHLADHLHLGRGSVG